MKSNEMYIRLDGMKYFAFHGVLPQETVVGAEYTVNLRLKTDFTHAAETDELDGTINYASVHEAVKSENGYAIKTLGARSLPHSSKIVSRLPYIRGDKNRTVQTEPADGCSGQCDRHRSNLHKKLSRSKHL